MGLKNMGVCSNASMLPCEKFHFQHFGGYLNAFWWLSECILVIFSNHLTPIYTGVHIQNKFWGWSYVLGPTFVVFLFGKKSQLFKGFKV